MKRDFTAQSSSPLILYHGTSAHIADGSIKPHWAKTHTGARQGTFTFASDNPLLAVAHAIKNRDCINAGYMNDEIYLLVADIDQYLGPEHKRLDSIDNAHVFELPVEQFELVEDHVYPYDEWVCKHSISIQGKTKHNIPSVSAAMEKGLQVFYLKTDEILPNEYFLTRGLLSPGSVASLINADRLGWLNKDKDIAPSASLGQAIDKLKDHQKADHPSYGDFFK